jgi:hypothetical protein
MRCNSTTNAAIDARIIALKISSSLYSNDILYVSILVLKRNLIFDVPFSIRCNLTTNRAIDAGTIALERYLSLLSNDILDVAKLVLQRKLLGFKQVVLRFDFNC